MDGTIFKAMVVQEADSGEFEISIKKKVIKDLPKADVLIQVKYSSLNYKDALSATGNRGVTKKFPHTPGIDASGIVVESKVDTFISGDEVLVTGYDLGMNTCGGFEEYIRVPAEWIVKLPEGLSLGESMIFGTAGFTAGMSIHALVEKVAPEDGPILVTGASGGVGCLTVSILAKLGYSVIAVSGKPDGVKFLNRLGAEKVIGREELLAMDKNPLARGEWGGVIDTVGGVMLANAIKSTKPWGVITCCGNAASPELALTVYPFILRGISLVGIDSQNCPYDLRKHIWQHLAVDWKVSALRDVCEEIGLEGLSHHIKLMLKGKQMGRVVVNLEA
jgi:acrylyl-CoA reductase (NADPH)